MLRLCRRCFFIFRKRISEGEHVKHINIVLKPIISRPYSARIFVKNFASNNRHLKGENGTVSNISKKVKIRFNKSPAKRINAFDHMRNILALEDVILTYPDFRLPFDLTTDASANGIGEQKTCYHYFAYFKRL